MTGLIAPILTLFAAKAPAADGGGAGSLFGALLPFLPVIILFYFMILRPQQQQEKRRRQMLDAMRKNDRVVTAGGIFGTVVSIDTEGDRVTLRIDDDKGVKMEVSRGSIARVVDTTEKEKEKAASASGSAK